MTSLFESKRELLLQYAGWYNCSNFVETGTGSGDMLEQLHPYFKESYSIELAKDLYQHAMMKFGRLANVHLYHGDSGEVLDLLPEMKDWTLYFLDAHFCGGSVHGRKETPIIEELNVIMSGRPRSIILIDDLKAFDGTQDYPTVEDLKLSVEGWGKSMIVEVIPQGGGMIAIYPEKKKRNLNHVLVKLPSRFIEAEPIAVSSIMDEETENHTKARPPVLYGPNR